MAAASVVKSGRVTPRKAKLSSSTEVVDVDALLASEGLQLRVIEDIPTFPMKIFNATFRVVKAVNSLALLMADSGDTDDTAKMVRSIINMIHPDDRKEFRDAYAAQAEITGEQLGFIIKSMVEGAAGTHPSTSQSDSGRTASRSTSRQLSTGS